MPDANLTRAAQAYGEVTAVAQQLYLAHCNARQGTPSHTKEEFEYLRKRMRETAAELVDACDAVPMSSDELFPE